MLVTIVGSSTPCLDLPRGEERTVQFTDRVQRLINGGFVEVVAYHDDPTDAGEAAADDLPREPEGE